MSEDYNMNIDDMLQQADAEAEKTLSAIDKMSTDEIIEWATAPVESYNPKTKVESSDNYVNYLVDEPEEPSFFEKAGRATLGGIKAMAENIKDLQDTLDPVQWVSDIATGKTPEAIKIFNSVNAKVTSELAFHEYLKENNFNRYEVNLNPKDMQNHVNEFMLHKKNFYNSDVGKALLENEIKYGRELFDEVHQRVFNAGAMEKLYKDEDVQRFVGVTPEELDKFKDTKFAGDIAGEVVKMYGASKLTGATGVTKLFSDADKLSKLQTIIKTSAEFGTFSGIDTAMDMDNNVKDVAKSTISGAALGAAIPTVGYTGMAIGDLTAKALGKTANKSMELASKAVHSVDKKLLGGNIESAQKQAAMFAAHNAERSNQIIKEYEKKVTKPFLDKTGKLKKKYIDPVTGKVKQFYATDAGNFDATKTTNKNAKANAITTDLLKMVTAGKTNAIEAITQFDTNLVTATEARKAHVVSDALIEAGGIVHKNVTRYNNFLEQAGKAGWLKDESKLARLKDILTGKAKATVEEKKIIKPLTDAIRTNRAMAANQLGKDMSKMNQNYFTKLAQQQVYDLVTTAKQLNLTEKGTVKYVEDRMGKKVSNKIIGAIYHKGMKDPNVKKSFYNGSARKMKSLMKRKISDKEWESLEETDVLKVIDHMMRKQTSELAHRNIAKGLRDTLKVINQNQMKISKADELWLKGMANKFDPKPGLLYDLRQSYQDAVTTSGFSPEVKKRLKDIKDPVTFISNGVLALNAVAGLAGKTAYMVKNATQPLQLIAMGVPIKHIGKSYLEAADILATGVIPKALKKQLGSDALAALKATEILRGNEAVIGAGIDTGMGKASAFIRKGLFANVTLSDRANVLATQIAMLKYGREIGLKGTRLRSFATVTNAMAQHMYSWTARSVLGASPAKPITMFTGWGYDTLAFMLHGRSSIADRFPEYAKAMVGKHPLMDATAWILAQNLAVKGLSQMSGYNLNSALPQNILKSTVYDTPMTILNKGVSATPIGSGRDKYSGIKNLVHGLSRFWDWI